jgi:glycosyltransferase involved in cell wall biosynthesis
VTHNEGRAIRRLLEQLINGADPGEMDIIVVASGCADDTAEVAASFGPDVRIPTPPVGLLCRGARLRASSARGDRQTCLRDESSRTAATAAARLAVPSGDSPAAPFAAVPRQRESRDHVPHNR